MAAAAMIVEAATGGKPDQRVVAMDHGAWPRGILLAMSDVRCTSCRGLGGAEGRPCRCVLRRVFRAVIARVWEIQESEVRPMQVRYYAGRRGRMPWISYARQYEDFVADVHLVARRSLSARQWKLFRWHYLEGRTYRFCCPRLGWDRANFFHECYRIEERLGRVFRELRPYALFPTREYFGVVRRGSPGGVMRRAA